MGIILLTLFGFNIFSQLNLSIASTNSDVIFIEKDVMKLNNLSYPYSFKGIVMLMDDLEKNNPELYVKLLPILEKLQLKSDKSKDWAVYTGVFGGIVTVTGLVMTLLSVQSIDI